MIGCGSRIGTNEMDSPFVEKEAFLGARRTEKDHSFDCQLRKFYYADPLSTHPNPDSLGNDPRHYGRSRDRHSPPSERSGKQYPEWAREPERAQSPTNWSSSLSICSSSRSGQTVRSGSQPIFPDFPTKIAFEAAQ